MSGILTHSPAEIIRQLLIDLSLATASEDWPVNFGGEADPPPDNVITVYNSAGILQGSLQPSGEQQDRHGFQVRVRGGKESVGYTKARAIAVALDEDVKLTAVTVSSTVYIIYSISREGNVISLGKNHPDSNLNLFTINATVALRQN